MRAVDEGLIDLAVTEIEAYCALKNISLTDRSARQSIYQKLVLAYQFLGRQSGMDPSGFREDLFEIIWSEGMITRETTSIIVEAMIARL